MDIKQPKFLKKGDAVRIISTARKVNQEEMVAAVQTLELWGLCVSLGKHLYSSSFQFAGTDEERSFDLQEALDDPNIKAIFCSRGGYGTPRIIDGMNWNEFIVHPKWIVGFSDITVLLNHVQHFQIHTLHAPLAIFFGKPEYHSSIEQTKQFLFGETLSYSIPAHPLNRNGECHGKLMGGNLSVLVNSIGTASQLDTKDKILFLEDIDEYLYHIDRMVLHLKRANIFESLSGLIVGHFTDIKDNPIPFGETAYEIIARYISGYHFPVCFGFPVGHGVPNLPLPLGSNMKLKTDNMESFIDFS